MRSRAKSGIRRLTERVGYADPDNPYVTLFYDDVQWPDGKTGRYTRIIEGRGLPGVAVLPVLGDMVGLILIDRYPVDRRLWEAPRGFGEGADPEADAVRELREETGWTAHEMVDIGVTYLNSGLLAGEVRLFIARVDHAGVATKLDESIRLGLFDANEVMRMYRAGDLPDAATQCLLLGAISRGILDPRL
jgi:ADP-ribose pyrophosphatase